MIGKALIALASGTLFGTGLAVSGMADPARVRGVLDVFDAWDPTLAFVIGGAVITMAAAWGLKSRLEKPLADLAIAPRSAILFVAPMLLGMVVQQIAGRGAKPLLGGPSGSVSSNSIPIWHRRFS